MYYILYNLQSLKVEYIYDNILPEKVKNGFYKFNGIAEYYNDIPKGDWLTVDNIREEIETWKGKGLNEQGQEIEVECSETHIVCDLVPHLRPKREPSEKQKAQVRIKELKKLLDETDYQALKFAEGVFTAEQYEPIKVQRQAWRDEINELEKI